MAGLAFLTKKDNDYYLNAFKADVYTPAYFFENENISVIEGDVLKTVGFLYMDIYNSPTSKPETYKINCAVKLSIPFGESRTERKKFKGTEEEEYKVFTIEKGSVIFADTLMAETGADAEVFMNYLLGGKLPEDLKYSQVPIFLNTAANMNGIKLGVPMTVIEAVCAEIARNPKDNFQSFRKVAGKTGAEVGYENVRIQDLPNLVSTFAGLAFEDINTAVSRGCVRGKNGMEETPSPFEAVIHC